MIKNMDGTYIYLVVPAKYECVYTKLLVKMSDLGVDLLKDCVSTCRGLNRQVLNCWNMFQAACCVYEIGEYKKADLLINYVNASLNFACTNKQSPVISNFKVNVANLKGNQRIEVSQATFTIDNIDSAKPDSLFIYYKNTDTVIQANKPLTSPLNFDEFQILDVEVGKTYTWYATIEGNDGTSYYSNIYTVNCVARPKELTMYWGPATVDGSAGAFEFKSKTATELMSLPGRQSKKIVGNYAQTFTINQTKNVHWLLIPDGMTLVHAEYGDALVSVLWHNDTKKGAYKEPFDAGEYDGIHYTMFFLYNPSGGFSEDIRITCKND